MKYLLVLAVVLVALWLWRNSRRSDRQQPPAAPPAAAQDMVRCQVCSVHLPRGDALPGPDGLFYCCQEHRLRAGG